MTTVILNKTTYIMSFLKVIHLKPSTWSEEVITNTK